MCGRYLRRSDKQRIAEAFALGNVDSLTLDLAPDYNVAPQTMQPVIVGDERQGMRTLHMLFWRFLPRYVTDPKQFKLSTINAKSETLLSNKIWQDFFFKRRCLIPADSFIEWKRQGKNRLPFMFAMKDDQPFALGGVWRRWRSPDPIQSMPHVTERKSLACKTMGPTYLSGQIPSGATVMVAMRPCAKFAKTMASCLSALLRVMSRGQSAA